ncbi:MULTISPECIES: hypothetical protein [unclassified Brenneria]|uniref:hypothetical protein n=1 Tax=unclassified Brenneria TaxID=2634434 RepID=UPI0029C556EA|nr:MULTISPECIES: hypothetical protein [unclassified Brenneria]MDX5627054.1 hypothetical protein [Brenneria sp. L3-3Z]MDX5693596.1 hypothetical protein [Brenneria sp. L4-2C]MEE3663533.1 hypothetical protein [Brenneria sp. g21c3]
MDGIRSQRTLDVEFSHKAENVTDDAPDLPVEVEMAAFEAIDVAGERKDCPEQRAAPQVLSAQDIVAQSERIKQLKNSSLCDPSDQVSDLASSFFIIALEGAHASGNILAGALHDAFSSPLDSEKTAMVESFEIAMKKEMLCFIKATFISEPYQPAASKVIENYIRELVARRDCVRLGAANAEFLLASGKGDEEYAEAVRKDIEALKQGTYHSQLEMRQALAIADNASSVVDMLDQFEMMLRSHRRSLAMLDTELRHLSLLADRWEDFVQKYAPWTLKKTVKG